MRRELLVGRAHRRSLGFARDDKFEGRAHFGIGGDGWTEALPQHQPDFACPRSLPRIRKLRRPEGHLRANLDSSG